MVRTPSFHPNISWGNIILCVYPELNVCYQNPDILRSTFNLYYRFTIVKTRIGTPYSHQNISEGNKMLCMCAWCMGWCPLLELHNCIFSFLCSGSAGLPYCITQYFPLGLRDVTNLRLELPPSLLLYILLRTYKGFQISYNYPSSSCDGGYNIVVWLW